MPVRAVNAGGAGQWSMPARATPMRAAAPGVPTGLVLIPGDTRVACVLEGAAGQRECPVGSGYQGQFRSTGQTWTDQTRTGLSSVTTITGLTNDIRCEVQIDAAGSQGADGWSPSAKRPPPGPAPVAYAPAAAFPTVRTSGLVLLVIHQHVGFRPVENGRYNRYCPRDMTTTAQTRAPAGTPSRKAPPPPIPDAGPRAVITTFKKGTGNR